MQELGLPFCNHNEHSEATLNENSLWNVVFNMGFFD